MPRIELHLAPGLVHRIEALAPRNFLASDAGTFEGPDRARRADGLLGRVWREIDDPFLRLLEEWSKPAAGVTVAYPPDEPERAIPVELLDSETTGWSRVGDLAGWSLVIPLGLFGLLAWGTGSYLLTGGSRWATTGLVLAGIPGVLLVGGQAVDLALELRDHPGRSRHVRWGAEDLLHALTLHPPSTNPYRLAVAERRRLLDRASATPRPTAD